MWSERSDQWVRIPLTEAEHTAPPPSISRLPSVHHRRQSTALKINKITILLFLALQKQYLSIRVRVSMEFMIIAASVAHKYDFRRSQVAEYEFMSTQNAQSWMWLGYIFHLCYWGGCLFVKRKWIFHTHSLCTRNSERLWSVTGGSFMCLPGRAAGMAKKECLNKREVKKCGITKT